MNRSFHVQASQSKAQRCRRCGVPCEPFLSGGAPAKPPKQPAGNHLVQNNSSYPAKVTAKLRELYLTYLDLRTRGATHDERWASLLKYYQFSVKALMNDPEFGVGIKGNSRGMLIYHVMGMGKTILAVGVAMGEEKRDTLVVLPHALQENFRMSIEWVVSALHKGKSEEDIARTLKDALGRFRFVSMDAYNMADQVSRVGLGARGAQTGIMSGTLDGKLLIVDEAHNFFRAIINSGSESTNARRLYDIIQEAKDLKIIFLTGTPASKDPFELVPCFNMLAGKDLLPTQYDTFYRLYVDKATRRVKNRGKLANRLTGYVSHVSPHLPVAPVASVSSVSGDTTGPKTTELPKGPRSEGGFPEELPTVIEKVEMAPDQYRQYLLAREKEEAEGKGGEGGHRAESIMAAPPLALPGSEKKAMRSYYVKSRSLSNFGPAREWAALPVDKMPDEAFDEKSSPKIALLTKRVETSPGSALVYSQFVDVGGLKVVARFLRNAGYKEFAPVKVGGGSPVDASIVHPGSISGGSPGESPADHPAAIQATEKRFAVISGEIPADVRAAIQVTFNSPQNSRGELIRVLLVSKTGAEGLDLKCLRQVHILEPYWDKAREDQVRSRGVRLGSHDRLPVEDRDVQTFIYMSVANRQMWLQMPEQNREEKTIDETFHERAMIRHELNVDFRKLLRSVSVECSLFGFGECRSCVPTNATLFHDDPAQDLRLPDPCEPTKAQEVRVKKVSLGITTYYYKEDPSELTGFQFFEFRKDLGEYAPMDPSDPVILELQKQLDAQGTKG